ncbi:MAG: histidinol-phosphate transaminase [Oscillospiraceae bacterium]
MSRFLSERFSELRAFVPGEQPRDRQYIKLNTNESPYPPAPQVTAAVNGDAISKLRLYGDPENRLLRESIGAFLGLPPSRIFAANGSDEVLSYIFMAFCDKDIGVSFPDISYGFYNVYADLYGLSKHEIPLNEDFSLEIADYFNLGTTIVLANPNAPTGLCISRADIESIVKANPNNIVAIDEAYIDFGGESALPLTEKYDNLLVVQTFSKSRSMAGARLGFAIGCEGLIADLERLRFSNNPFNINSLSSAAGIAAIEGQAYYDKNTAEIIQTRDYSTKKLQELGFILTKSETNFLFLRHPKLEGRELYSGLRERGILVRHFDKPRTRDYVRITVGTPPQMEQLISALQELVS